MKRFRWLYLLMLAVRLAAQENETPSAGSVFPIEEAETSPFWEQVEASTGKQGSFFGVVRPPKDDATEPAGPSHPVMVHAVVFRTEDQSVVLDALAGGREHEAALFEHLAAMEQEGTASVVLEQQLMTVGSRISTMSAIRQTSYPTELERLDNPFRNYPTAWESRNTGDTIAVTPRFRGEGIHFVAQVASVRRGNPSRWPMVDAASPAGPERTLFNLQPQFLVDECTTTTIAKPSQPRLLALAPEAREADETEKPTAWRLTFLRALAPDESPGASSGVPLDGEPDVRCDVVVFRIPFDEAAAWLWNPGTRDDAKEWDQFIDRVRAGEIAIASQWTLAAGTGPVRRGGPPEASLSSLGEFSYPTQHENFTATAFETRNSGLSCRVRLRRAADGRGLLGKIAVEAVKLDRIRQWPCSPDAPDLNLLQPEFNQAGLRTDVVLPAAGITFLGLRNAGSFGADPDNSKAMADLYFIKTFATPNAPPADAPTAPPVVEWRTLVFSVDETAVTDLRLLMETPNDTTGEDQGQVLRQLVEEGSAHVTQTAAVVVADGGRGTIGHFDEVIYPVEIDPRQLSQNIIPLTALETQITGLELKFRPRVAEDGKSVTADLEFDWAASPPHFPVWDDYRRCAEARSDDVPYPAFFHTLRPTPTQKINLAAGRNHLLRLEKAVAPTGSPEHGRWHAVLVWPVVKKVGE